MIMWCLMYGGHFPLRTLPQAYDSEKTSSRDCIGETESEQWAET